MDTYNPNSPAAIAASKAEVDLQGLKQHCREQIHPCSNPECLEKPDMCIAGENSWGCQHCTLSKRRCSWLDLYIATQVAKTKEGMRGWSDQRAQEWANQWMEECYPQRSTSHATVGESGDLYQHLDKLKAFTSAVQWNIDETEESLKNQKELLQDVAQERKKFVRKVDAVNQSEAESHLMTAHLKSALERIDEVHSTFVDSLRVDIRRNPVVEAYLRGIRDVFDGLNI